MDPGDHDPRKSGARPGRRDRSRPDRRDRGARVPARSRREPRRRRQYRAGVLRTPRSMPSSRIPPRNRERQWFRARGRSLAPAVRDARHRLGGDACISSECLQDVWPLEERLGWDGLDELQATVKGWKTATLLDLPFRHHRRVGHRDGQRRIFWSAEGRLAHYMDYRIGYLMMRVAFRALRDRDAAAVWMLWGYGRLRLGASPAGARRSARAPSRAAAAP